VRRSVVMGLLVVLVGAGLPVVARVGLAGSPAPDVKSTGTAATAATAARPDRAVVLKAQQALIATGRLKSRATGVLNPATRSAIRAFQKQHGLKSTGALSPETLALLGIPVDTTAKR
jgi:peptidoglycan DL-endopeptidase CwlO